MAGKTTTDSLMCTKLHRSPVSPHMSVNNSSSQNAKIYKKLNYLYTILELVQYRNDIRISDAYEM